MKVLISVNLSTIKEGKSELLLLEAKDCLDKRNDVSNQLIKKQNRLHKIVSQTE